MAGALHIDGGAVGLQPAGRAVLLGALGVLAGLAWGCARNPSTGPGCLTGAAGCQVPSPCQRVSFSCDTSGPLEIRALAPSGGTRGPGGFAPGGLDAQAARGDVLLSNGRAVAVIAGLGNQNHIDPNGGSILDLSTAGDDNDSINQILQVTGILPADAVRYTRFELIDQRPTRVALQLRGTLDGHPDTPVSTLYEMRPCDPGVRVRTEILNRGPEPQLWFLADGFYWGGRDALPFIPSPGAGFAHPGFNLLDIDGAFRSHPFLAGAGHVTPAASYAAVACNAKALDGFENDLVSGAGLPKGIVEPRDFRIYERFIAVARGPGLAPATDLALEVRRQLFGENTVAVRGTVTSLGLGPLGEERTASVLLSESADDPRERVPWTQVVPGSDGTFRARVPAGKRYRLELHSLGTLRLERELGVLDSDTDVGTLSPSASAHLAASAIDLDSGAPVDAEVVLIPADEATRSAVTGSFHGAQDPCAPWLGMPYGGSPACNRFLTRAGGVSAVEVPPGSYHAYAFKGPFWSLDRRTFSLASGQSVALMFSLRRMLQPAGAVSADLHVHGAASFDSSIPDLDRILSFSAMELEVMVASDHDVVTDYGDAVSRLGLSARMNAIPGVETTGHIPFLQISKSSFPLVIGHYNFWPLKFDPTAPRNGAPFDELLEPGQLFDRMAEEHHYASELPVIQLNHPWANPEFGRDLGFPRAISFDATRPLPPDDDGTPNGVFVRAKGHLHNHDHQAQEVMNGSQNDLYLPYRAFWFYMLNQGSLKTGTANSDSHGLTDNTIGFPRNLVFADTRPGPTFDVDAFNAALRSGRNLGTNGPLIEATLDTEGAGRQPFGLLPLKPAPGAQLHLQVFAAPWVPVDEIRIVVNGAVVKTVSGAELSHPDDPFGTDGSVLLRYRGDLPLAPLLAGISGDAWLVVEAGRPLLLAGDLGGGVDDHRDGIPDTTDNNGDGVVDARDVEPGQKIGPLINPPAPSPDDPRFHFSAVVAGGYPCAFTNPFVLDLNGNGRFDPPGISGGR